MFFNQLRFHKRQFCSGTRFSSVKKHKVFIAVFTTIYQVEPALAVDPIFLFSTILMGVVRTTLAEPASLMNKMISSFLKLGIKIVNRVKWRDYLIVF